MSNVVPLYLPHCSTAASKSVREMSKRWTSSVRENQVSGMYSLLAGPVGSIQPLVYPFWLTKNNNTQLCKENAHMAVSVYDAVFPLYPRLP